MKKESYKRILEGLGLTENEASVYLATLHLGPTTVLAIARASDIRRTTVYLVIDSLKQKGLIATQVHGFKKRYVAESPEKLESMLESKRSRFRNILPDLYAFHNLKGGESAIKYYEGINGIKSVYDMILKDIRPHDYCLAVSDPKQFLDADPDYFNAYIEKRAKLKVEIRILLQDSSIAQRIKKYERNYNAHVKILPKKFSFKASFTVTPQHMVVQQFTEPVLAMVINNRSIIEMHKELFEIMWESTK